MQSLDELALVGDPCDSGTVTSFGGDVGTGTDVGTSVGSTTGNRSSGNDGEVCSGFNSQLAERATCCFRRRPSETSTK